MKLLGTLPPLPPSPGGELVLFLAVQGETSRTVVRRVVPELARALEVLQESPYGEVLEARGERIAWTAPSDARAFWEAVRRGEFDTAWALYAELAPGYMSPLPTFGAWLEEERGRMQRAVVQLAWSHPAEAVRARMAEALQAPRDRTQALAALLIQADAHLRLGEARAAVHTLARALGLQELTARAFSALSLALLAEAQAAWGHARKARETAEKALARTQDPYTRSRAYHALYRATGDAAHLEAARAEAARASDDPWRGFLAGVR
ncbi:hypothetical protein [Marinithermus hydrothermalis]|uniref:hypothetical protein n=1 Tax=Marinithermus hydrothermalis TaxID=186192 RepID=UPI0002DB4802|nr:hypothetical protein [Marinithermus hydrothermalis]